MKRFVFTGIFGISLLFLISCGGDEAVVQKTYDYQKADSLPSEYTSSLGNIRVSIEDGAVLNKMLKDSGYAYNGSVLNSPGKASGYSSSKMQALNLGVYGSDLNYAFAYEQSQDVMNGFKSIIELSKKLGVESAFNQEMIEKLTNAADTSTDKSIMLTRAYRHAQDNLHSNERAALATLMVVGGWIEALYIYTSNLKNKPGTGEINQKVWDHVMTFKDAIKMLTVWKNNGNKDCEEILNDLSSILGGPISPVIESKGNIQPAQIEALHGALSTLRAKIVG